MFGLELELECSKLDDGYELYRNLREEYVWAAHTIQPFQ